MTKLTIEAIVLFIKTYIKKFLFELKKRKINNEIKKARKELHEESKNLQSNYDTFNDLYSKYKSGQQKSNVRPSLRVVRDNSEKSEESDK